MTVAEEKTKRKKTCRFIEESGRVLRLPRVAVATAMVFFHRFYAKHSFNEHDRFEVAAACVLLAAKTEESPKKLSVVIQECHRLKNRGMQRGGSSPGPVGSGGTGGSLDPKGEEFLKLKERILLLERVILHTIGFELSVDHPYKFLVDQIKKLLQTRQIEYVKPPPPSPSGSGGGMEEKQKMMKEMMQAAMNFANDSMQTSLCLQFPAKSVAAGCVYLSGQYCKIRPTGGRSWADVLGSSVDVESLTSISLQIVELIADKKGANPQMFKAIRADLDQMSERSGERGVGAASSSGRDAKRPRVG